MIFIRTFSAPMPAASLGVANAQAGKTRQQVKQELAEASATATSSLPAKSG